MINSFEDPQAEVVIQLKTTALTRDKLRHIGKVVYGANSLADFMRFLIDREVRDATGLVEGSGYIKPKYKKEPVTPMKAVTIPRLEFFPSKED